MRTLMLSVVGALAILGQPRAAPLTNIAQVIGLSPDAAGESWPVSVRAVVTCYAPLNQLCFIQDATAGIYLLPSDWPGELRAGEVVEVDGVATSGRFSPIIRSTSIRRTGQRASLQGTAIAIEQLNTGHFDCRLVRVQGTVQAVQAGSSPARLDLWSGANIAKILVYGASPAITNLVDARVEVEGVAGTFYDRERLAGFGVFAQGPANLKVLKPAAPPFEASLRSIRNLAPFSRDHAMDHRVRLRGVATLVWPGEALFLRDETASIRVALAGAPPVRAGDLVEVAGFVRDALTTPWLDHALARKGGTNALPLATVIEPAQLIQIPPNAGLYTVEGTLAHAQAENGVSIIWIHANGHSLKAFVPGAVTQRPGATIRVSGVWSQAPATIKRDSGLGLWLASPAQITVVAEAPQPRPGPGKIHPAWTGVAAIVMLAAGWVAWKARARVQLSRRELGQARERLLETEKHLRRLNQSREKLGRDLHDHIIQSIYAVGLNLDDLAQSLEREPARAEGRLKKVLDDINRIIRDLRNLIQGLESSTIEPRELRAALKSLAVTQESSGGVRLELEESALEALSVAQATELVQIAREALSNSIRHGHAQTTTIGLHRSNSRLRFVIEDDGKGFDPEQTGQRGFGLRNMSRRAENLRGELAVESAEGKGTRIVLDIPVEKQHFSVS